jgi:hypothetical protein
MPSIVVKNVLKNCTGGLLEKIPKDIIISRETITLVSLHLSLADRLLLVFGAPSRFCILTLLSLLWFNRSMNNLGIGKNARP